MADFLVVGSGATGVHAARTLLEQGAQVTMVDAGYTSPAFEEPDLDIDALKARPGAQQRYFLGPRGEGVVYPSPDAKPYGFPPSKAHVFRRPEGVVVEERGFVPMLSFARGGLAEAWTGGCYELRDEELAVFPFAQAELRPHYRTVADRIGVAAALDDLGTHSPMTASYQTPLPPDPHSAWLLERYDRRRDRLWRAGVRIGRSRVALLSQALDGRQACGHLGRCHWGCPRGALYSPRHTLDALLRHGRFSYRPGVLVDHVRTRGDGSVRGVALRNLDGSGEVDLASERVILAAGALATTRIYLRTMAMQGRPEVVLPGLMDNRHLMIPFLSPARVGADVPLASYQYHMLALAVDLGGPLLDAHGQITTLKSAAVHPIVAALPFDLGTALGVFRRLRAGLGVANVWLPDTRREGNVARLAVDAAGRSRLVLEYTESETDGPAASRALGAVRLALGRLGCVAPSVMARQLPRGSSVHYAGTLPMTRDDREHTLRPDGAVRGFAGLYVVDGAGFPWLPAKNITFTLMANAVRIASGLA